MLLDEAPAEAPAQQRMDGLALDLCEQHLEPLVAKRAVIEDEDRLVGILSYVDVLVWLRDSARMQEAAPAQP